MASEALWDRGHPAGRGGDYAAVGQLQWVVERPEPRIIRSLPPLAQIQ